MSSELCDPGNRKMLPLDKKTCEAIRLKKQDLINMVDLQNGLVDALFANGCISRAQLVAVNKRHVSEYHNNRQLLDILSRKSLADFDVFIECLIGTGQQYVAELLTKNAGNSNG
jgi:hypothetical protein